MAPTAPAAKAPPAGTLPSAWPSGSATPVVPRGPSALTPPAAPVSTNLYEGTRTQARAPTAVVAPKTPAPTAPGDVTAKAASAQALLDRQQLAATIKREFLGWQYDAGLKALLPKLRPLGPSAYPVLLQSAASDHTLNDKVALLFQNLGPQARLFLERALKTPGTSETAAALMLHEGAAQHVVLLHKLTNAKSEIQQHVWHVLSQNAHSIHFADPRSRAILKAWMKSSDPIVRARAALLCLSCEIPVDKEAALGAMQAFASEGHVQDHARVAFLAVQNSPMASTAGAALLEQLTYSSNTEARTQAFRALSHMHPQDKALCLRAANDSELLVRLVATNMDVLRQGLTVFPMPADIATAVQALSIDPDDFVRQAVVEMTGSTLSKLRKTVAELSQASPRSPAVDQELDQARKALTNVLGIVFQHINDRHKFTRTNAIKQLVSYCRIDDIAGVLPLLSRADIDDSTLSAFAARLATLVTCESAHCRLPTMPQEALRPLMQTFLSGPGGEHEMAMAMELLSPHPATELLKPYLASFPNNPRAKELLALIKRAEDVGIQHPFRMSLDTLNVVLANRERKAGEGKSDPRRLAVMILPKGGQLSDWDAAFYHTQWIDNHIKAGYQVMVYEADDETKIAPCFANAISVTGIVPSCVADGAHGDKSGATHSNPGLPGPLHEKYAFDVGDLDIMRQINKQLTAAWAHTPSSQRPPNDTITWIQISCSTGVGGPKDPTSFASRLTQNIDNLRVLAPEHPGSLDHVEFDEKTRAPTKAVCAAGSPDAEYTEFPARAVRVAQRQN